MADQSAAVSGYGLLTYQPGNPTFPTLPASSDPTLGKLDEWGVGAEHLFITKIPIFPPIGESATKSVGFADWYTNTIWATPVPIDFGDISDEKDVVITLHSTYLDDKTLDDIAIPVAGLDLVGASSPLLPLTIEPFSDQILTFRASAVGPNDFDEDITFSVGDDVFEVRTLGRRVLLLFSAAENGATERLEFATDIMRSKDGTEQAFSLRLAPRSTIQYTFRMSEAQAELRTRIRTILLGGAPNLSIGVQLWWEARKITSAALAADLVINCDTSNMQIAAEDNVVFTTPSLVNVIGEVESFTASTITLTQAIGAVLPPDTYCIPIRYGRLMRGSASTRTAQVGLEDIIVEITTEDDNDISALDSTYFDLSPFESPGRPILKERCMRGARVSGTIEREQQVIDSVTGRIYITGSEAIGEETHQMHVWINSSPQLYAWREFLHYVRGSWSKFYMPTFQNDLPLVQDITLGGNTFLIPEMGIANLLGGAAPKRDLRIVTDDGSVYYRRITSVIDNGNGTETVTVSDIIGSGSPDTSAIEGTVISWLNLVRIDADTARLNHTYLGQAELSFKVRTVKE